METIKYKPAFPLRNKRGLNTFAVGHLSLAYLIAKVCSKSLKVKINLPLVFLLGLIPDVDLLIPGLHHRGLTHSMIISTITFIPLFVIYKKRAIPYFAALAQHIIIGDLLIGEGIQLLWPMTQTWYGLGTLITSPTDILLEWISFLTADVTMLATKDMQKLLYNHQSNLPLSVPTLTVLLPSFLHFPLAVPRTLLIPHLVYLGLFTVSLLAFFKSALKVSK